jgi:ApbE superfamily uncharacterized protein (UPF0280 family)
MTDAVGWLSPAREDGVEARARASAPHSAFVRGALRTQLPDGRWHFQHGPIDLILEAWGEAPDRERAYAQAWQRFTTVLEELVRELPLLRSELRPESCPLAGPTARRMWHACRPFAGEFITPMAAVAGAVADEVLDAMLAGTRLCKAYVNNGGDIALHLAKGESLAAGIVGDLARPSLSGLTRIACSDGVRGVATSGWRGRSFSLGIADAVTVLARDGAAADAAATMIANAVDVTDPAVERRPARALDPDSDLGERLVTVAVGALPAHAIEQALARGSEVARRYRTGGLIVDAYLELCGRLAGSFTAALPFP